MRDIVLASLAFLPLMAASGHSEAPRADMDGFWRSFFARPAGPPPSPDGNPATPEKTELGRKLFFDTRLSGDGRRSCAFCHQPDKGFTDGRAGAPGLDGKALSRNTPTLLGAGWGKSFMWDGRAATLEEQAAMPLLNANEMAGDWNRAIAAIKREPPLDVAFHIAFRQRPAVQPETILGALASFVRTIAPPETRFDKWVAGDDGVLSDDEKTGFRLFVGRAGCVGCHQGWRFTDDKMHDVGVRSADPGRGAVVGGLVGLPAFKTPTLRGIEHTGPYMHDGSLETLEAVVEHYAGKLDERPTLDSSVVRGLKLEASEMAALVAFLKTL